MSERLSITPLGPYIGAQISGADLTRPLSDNQFEQLYHAVLRHQVVFLRAQAITPQQQRALAQRFGELHIHPVYPHAEGVDEIIVLDTHNDNPPDNDNRQFARRWTLRALKTRRLCRIRPSSPPPFMARSVKLPAAH
jgi:taurine dioxygenase